MSGQLLDFKAYRRARGMSGVISQATCVCSWVAQMFVPDEIVQGCREGITVVRARKQW